MFYWEPLKRSVRIEGKVSLIKYKKICPARCLIADILFLLVPFFVLPQIITALVSFFTLSLSYVWKNDLSLKKIVILFRSVVTVVDLKHCIWIRIQKFAPVWIRIRAFSHRVVRYPILKKLNFCNLIIFNCNKYVQYRYF